MAFSEGIESNQGPIESVSNQGPVESVNGFPAPETQITARRPMEYWQTILFAATALVVMAIAASFAATKVNSAIAGVAEKQVIGLAEETTTRDALHIQSMVVGSNSMIGMNAGHTMDVGPDGTMSMESDGDSATPAGHDMTNGAEGTTAMNGEGPMAAMEADGGQDTHAGHVMTNGADGTTAMDATAAVTLVAADTNDGAAMVLGNAPLTLDLLIGPSGLPMHYSMLVEGLGVVESSLFNLNGELVWSTNPDATADLGGHTSRIEDAVAGLISSQLIKDNDVVGADGVVTIMDVVSTFVPLQDSPLSPVVGVLEINREVGTELGALVDDTKSTVLWTTVTTMGGLFLALVGFVVVSDRMIFRSHERKWSWRKTNWPSAQRPKSGWPRTSGL